MGLELLWYLDADVMIILKLALEDYVLNMCTGGYVYKCTVLAKFWTVEAAAIPTAVGFK